MSLSAVIGWALRAKSKKPLLQADVSGRSTLFAVQVQAWRVSEAPRVWEQLLAAHNRQHEAGAGSYTLTTIWYS